MNGIRRGSRFGPFRFVAELDADEGSRRWLVLHERDRTNHSVHLFDPIADSGHQRRALGRLGMLAAVRHTHLPTIESYSLTPDRRPMVVTPYTGTHEGLVSLQDLCDRKGGTLPAIEVRRAVEQLLSALVTAHASLPSDVRTGMFSSEQVQVDRSGRLWLDGYGLRAAVSGKLPGFSPAAVVGDELRSVIHIAYRLLSGARPQTPAIQIGSLVPRLDRSLERWIDAGLSPTAGFDDAASALEALSNSAAPSSTRPPAQRAAESLVRLWKRRAPVEVSADPVVAQEQSGAGSSSSS